MYKYLETYFKGLLLHFCISEYVTGAYVCISWISLSYQYLQQGRIWLMACAPVTTIIYNNFFNP